MLLPSNAWARTARSKIKLSDRGDLNFHSLWSFTVECVLLLYIENDQICISDELTESGISKVGLELGKKAAECCSNVAVIVHGRV